MPQIADVDLRLLRVFVTVSEAGGFSAAQAHLNVSASTISNHMAALEKRLDVKLCQRGRVGFRLTDKGRVIYDAARKLLGAVEDFRVEAGSVRGHLVGDLKIGLVDNTVTDARAPVVGAIRRFGGREHRVYFHLAIDGPQELETRVLDGRLDLAIGSFPKHVSGLSYTPLYLETQRFYCGRLHPLARKPQAPAMIEEIRRDRIVTRGYWTQNDLVRLDLPAASAAATVYHMEAQAILILSGHYVGFLPAHYAGIWVRNGELVELLPEILAYEAPFEVVSRRGVKSTRAVTAFLVDLIAEKVEAEGQSA